MTPQQRIKVDDKLRFLQSVRRSHFAAEHALVQAAQELKSDIYKIDHELKGVREQIEDRMFPQFSEQVQQRAVARHQLLTLKRESLHKEFARLMPSEEGGSEMTKIGGNAYRALRAACKHQGVDVDDLKTTAYSR